MSGVHDHLSERLNRDRLALELRRSLRPALILTAGLVLGLACMGYIVSQVGREVYTGSQTVRLALDSGRAVRAGLQDVKVKGITAGSITDARLVDGQPVITAKVERRFGPIYRDARAVLRPKTVLQDMYLDIVYRGTEAAGKADAATPLPQSQTRTSVNVADVLQTFDPDTREHLGHLLDGLGTGLDDRGQDLREAFVRVVPLLEVAGEMSGALAQRSVITRRLMHNSTVLTGELARRERQLRTIVEAGAATLSASADGADDLRTTIAELPPTLDRADTSLIAVRAVLGDVDGALRSLDPVAERLPAGLDELQRLSAVAQPAVERLQEPVRELVPLAVSLLPASTQLRTTSTALRPQVPDIDHITTSTVGCLFAVERFFQWTPSVFKMEDARGPAPRAFMTTGLGATGATKDPNVFRADSCAPGAAIAGVSGPGGTG